MKQPRYKEYCLELLNKLFLLFFKLKNIKLKSFPKAGKTT